MLNTKKLVAVLLTGAMILGTASAVFAESDDKGFSFSKTETNSETITVKDTLGNEYEVTHVVETVDGETSEHYENVPFEVTNKTPDEIVALYIANSDADTWGANWLDSIEEGLTIKSETYVCGLTMNYYIGNTLVDIQIETADGYEITFDDFDLSDLEDPTHFDLIFFVEDDGSYKLSIQ